MSDILDAPCVFCGYNGARYWQADTHSPTCPWRDIGSYDERNRLKRSAIRALFNVAAEIPTKSSAAVRAQRFSKSIPGFDCTRFPCGKGSCRTTPGSHGIGATVWVYAVSDDGVALSLRVDSAIYPESVPQLGRPQPGDPWAKPRGTWLHIHATFPVKRESIRDGKTGEECEYLGTCFAVGEGSVSRGEKLFADAGGVAQFEQPEAFWVALEKELERVAADARSQNVSDKFARCHHCGGVGTIVQAPTEKYCVP